MKTLYIALALSVSTPAMAADYLAVPTPAQEDTLTYFKGVASIERKTEFGSIRITSIGEETGKPAFVIEITNVSEASVNFGTENISATIVGQKKPTLVYSAADIQRMVESKAAWAAALTSLSGALATNTSRATACGYRGCYTATIRTPDYFARANASRQINAIYENSADRVDELKNSYLQTTTVEPGQSYGGRVALSKPKVKQWPASLSLTVLGQVFNFDVRK
jgi:hypothetical protein